jgi:hypothetical protein
VREAIGELDCIYVQLFCSGDRVLDKQDGLQIRGNARCRAASACGTDALRQLAEMLFFASADVPITILLSQFRHSRHNIASYFLYLFPARVKGEKSI